MGNAPQSGCCRPPSDHDLEAVDASATEELSAFAGKPAKEAEAKELSAFAGKPAKEAEAKELSDFAGNPAKEAEAKANKSVTWPAEAKQPISKRVTSSWASAGSAESLTDAQRRISRSASRLPDSFRAYTSSKKTPTEEEVRVFFSSVNSSCNQAEWTKRYLTPNHGQGHDMAADELQAQFSVLMPDVLGSEEVARIIDRIGPNDKGRIMLEDFQTAMENGVDSSILGGLLRRFREGFDHGFEVPETYDYEKPTSHNYADRTCAFVGDFADVRRGRDYNYHSRYSTERQMWQDHAIHQVIEHVSHQIAPWLVYTCGPMGVGKGYALSWMSRNGFFPMESIAHVDPDGFKQMMPEWCQYVEKNRSSAGSMCHAESTFMMEIAQIAAMQKRQHVWIDGSLRDADFYSEQFQEMRSEYPHYRIAIFYVDAPEAVIRQRIQERAQKTGRDVPEHLIKASLSAMDRSLNKLTPLCDFVARIDNGGAVPVLRSFEAIDNSGSWNLIKERFTSLTTAGEFPHALAPLPMARLPPAHMQVLRKDASSDSKIGFAVTLEVLKNRGEVPELHNKVVSAVGTDLTFQVSKVCDITLPAFARHLAMIPLEAKSFVWMYPHAECQEGGRLHQKLVKKKGFTREDMLDPLMQMLRQGGFLYLSSANDFIAVNFVSSAAENFVLQFGLPKEVPQKCVSALSRGRLQPVPRAYFRNRGASHFMWAHPGEKAWDFVIGQEHGSFVYIFDETPRRALVYPVMAAD